MSGARPGRLYGIGLGPGDPRLLTLRAVELLRTADVVAYHAGPRGSTARRIAAGALAAREAPAIEEELTYPVTAGGGPDYAERMAAFYAEASARLGAHLAAGRSVAVASLGDPMLYSSYQHLHRALAEYAEEIVPGVASPSAAAAALGEPLAEAGEILTVLPATAGEPRLAAAAAAADALVVMKLGGHVGRVRRVLAAAGMLERARVVARATMGDGWTAPLAEVDDAAVPYFAVAVVPSAVAGRRAAAAAGAPGDGEVVVVGLGPGPARWLTPEAAAELAAATDVVGYGTYVDRVPRRPGQRRHPSDNRVEAERAAMALDLAAGGARVAVVSSGDPGVFAMGAAVLEVARDPRWAGVPVRIVPGMTAAQAVASRVGAPLGHDFAMISLSDRLKPWPVVARRVAAVAAADMAMAVYNPASRTRRRQVVELLGIVGAHRGPDTPVVVARAVGAAEEEVTVTTLAGVDPEVVDMRTMLIIGASTTVAYPDGAGGTRVYTARRYGGAPGEAGR